MNLDSNIFLSVFGYSCTAGLNTGYCVVDVASEEYKILKQDYTRTLYTLTVKKEDFTDAKEGTTFITNGVTYKALKPGIVKDDLIIFLCGVIA